MNYIAIANEPKEPNFNEIIAQTKTPFSKYKGMTKEEFTKAVKLITWVSFRVEEI